MTYGIMLFTRGEWLLLCSEGWTATIEWFSYLAGNLKEGEKIFMFDRGVICSPLPPSDQSVPPPYKLFRTRNISAYQLSRVHGQGDI